MVLKEVMSKYNYDAYAAIYHNFFTLTCVFTIDVEDIYRILTLHTLIPHLISVSEVWEAKVEVLWIPKLNSPFCQNRYRVVHSI